MKFLFMKKDFHPSYASMSKNMCLAFVTGYISCDFLPQFHHKFYKRFYNGVYDEFYDGFTTNITPNFISKSKDFTIDFTTDFLPNFTRHVCIPVTDKRKSMVLYSLGDEHNLLLV